MARRRGLLAPKVIGRGRGRCANGRCVTVVRPTRDGRKLLKGRRRCAALITVTSRAEGSTARLVVRRAFRITPKRARRPR
jgi:hypothetical protein